MQPFHEGLRDSAILAGAWPLLYIYLRKECTRKFEEIKEFMKTIKHRIHNYIIYVKNSE
jgi:hypothetical protein